jgi:hypothetical protein
VRADVSAEQRTMRANSDTTANQTGLLPSNPFHILGVTPRDGRLTIIEHAEERGLHGDQALCQRARSDLTNPRTRLHAELGWFPGVEPSLVEHLRLALQSDPMKVLASPAGLPALARANLMCAGFERVDPQPADTARIAEFVREFGQVVDRLELTAIVNSVNEDRRIAGFPDVQDLGVVDENLGEMRKRYKSVLVDLLDRMPSAMLVETMTLLVGRATANGSATAAALIDDLVDAYALETQALLESERENMAKMAERILGQAGEGEEKVNAAIDRILLISRHWCHIARPIQLSMKARGMANHHSEQLAGELRELGVGLFNKHGMHGVADRMTGLLIEIFSGVPRAREQLEADALRLKEIEQERLQVQRWDAEWRRAISFQAEAGLWSKHPLRISPEGVNWQGQHLRLSDITQVRWGGNRQLLNGLPVGTYHSVDIADAQSTLNIRMRKEPAYTAFIHSLWRAVCVRLMYEMAHALKAGRTLSFDAVHVQDEGVMLRGSAQRVGWNEVKVSSSNGFFVIESRHKGGPKGQLSYAKVWNVHVLEQVVRAAVEKGSARLSDYLNDAAAA